MLIQLDQHRKLYTTLYNKPTDSHSFLHFCPCHPHCQKTGGPISQLLRVKRICTLNADFEKNSLNILEHYGNRGYPASVLQTSLDKVTTILRSNLFTITEVDEPPTEPPLLCITTYHPQNPPIKDILKQNWPILLIDPNLQCVYDETPVFGHKRLKNLRGILVCSKLTYPPKEPKPKGGINPSKICNNINCKYFPKLDLSGLNKSTTTGRTFIVPSKITCKFNNLIYLITCKKCLSQYVGQTMNTLHVRFQKHL